MTVQSPPSYLQNGSHSAAVFRQAIAATWQEGGPVQPNELWVAAQGTPNMSVQVGAGRAVIQGTQASAPGLLPSGLGIFTSQAMYTALNDAAVTVTISASDPTNPRIDVVYIAVQDSFYSGSNNQALVGVVTGTPAASPVAPAAPANAEVLAQVTVAANATTITNGVIANQVSPATAIGQPTTVDTYAHLLLWAPKVAGTYADVNADSTATNDGLYRWDGAGWLPVGHVVSATASGTQSGITTTATVITGLSVTVTTAAVHALRITATISTLSTVGADVAEIQLFDGATNVYHWDLSANSGNNNGSTNSSSLIAILPAQGAGTHAYTLKIQRVAGSGSLSVIGSSTQLNFLGVEVVG